jgi:hypothetical protein
VNVYFAEFIVNEQSYGVQINCFPIPAPFLVAPSTTFSTGGVSYTTPSAWVNPGAVFTPTITMCNPVTLAFTNFYKTVGFPALWSSFNTNGVAPYTYTVNPATSATSQNSTTAPNVQPNPTLFFAISNIDNKYSNPSTIVYQINADVGFGQLINITPPQFAFNKLLPGTYNGLRLSILGTNFQPIDILDPAMTITMVIKDRKDVSLGDALATAQGGK